MLGLNERVANTEPVNKSASRLVDLTGFNSTSLFLIAVLDNDFGCDADLVG
jgi:hypothetical protein